MATATKPLTLTDSNFEEKVLENDRPVLVDFWAEWCGPCKQLEPVIDALAKEFDGRATVSKVDVDQQQELAARFNVRSIPTLIFFADGEVVDQARGLLPKQEIADRLSRLVPA